VPPRVIRRACALAALAGASGACLFVDIDESLVSPTDASEDGATDAEPKGDASDAGSGDAGDGAVDAPSTFCTSQTAHSFCADFDESTNLAPPWTMVRLSPRGTVDAGTSVYRSAPRSLNVTLLAPTSDPNDSVGVMKRFARKSPVVRIRFALKPHAVPAADNASFAFVQLGLSPYYAFALNVTPSGTYAGELFPMLDGATANAQHYLSASAPVDTWTTVEIRLDIGAGNDAGTFEVRFDDASVGTFPRAPYPIIEGDNDSIVMGGYLWSGNTDGGVISSDFDDVVLDW